MDNQTEGWSYMFLKSAPFFIVFLFITALPVVQIRAKEPIRIGDIRIETFWARASIGVTRPGAAYLTVVNEGAAADRLVEVKTPVAAKAEIHETAMVDGVMKMNPAGSIIIPSGGRVELKPGGLHVMLMGLQAPLIKDETFPLTLRFEKNGSGVFDIPIAGPGAMRPPQ